MHWRVPWIVRFHEGACGRFSRDRPIGGGGPRRVQPAFGLRGRCRDARATPDRWNLVRRRPSGLGTADVHRMAGPALHGAGGNQRRDGVDGRALGHLGATARINDLTTIRYWSTTRHRWRDLIPDATALSSPDPAHRRTDFGEAELRAGPIFFWQEENTPLEAVTYRMAVREVDARTVVVEINNALPARATLFASVPPGHHEFLYRFHRRDDGRWSLYGLMRSGSGPRLIARAGRKSYGNRAVALFRYLAGESTDGAPPLFP